MLHNELVLLLRKKKDPGACLLQNQESCVVEPGIISFRYFKVARSVKLIVLEGGNGSRDPAYYSLHQEDVDDLSVGKLLKLAQLELWLRGVHHDLGLVACVDSDTNDPPSITDRTSSQQYVLAAKSQVPVVGLISTLEAIDLVVRGLAC